MRIQKVPYDRFRESNNTSFSTETYSVYARNRSTTVSPSSGCRIGIYRNMLDRVTPAYKEMSAAGQLINSPVTSKKCTFSIVQKTGWGHEHAAAVSDGAVYKGVASWGLGSVPLGFEPPAPLCSTGTMITAAVTQAMANVNQPVVQGLAFVGELQQTIDLLRHPFSALSKFFARPLKKRKKRIPNKTGKGYTWTTEWEINRNVAIGAIASQTLAFNFGVKPLLHDIEGILEALVFRHPLVLRQTARGFQKDARNTFSSGNYASSGFIETVYGVAIQEEVLVRAGVLYAFKGETLAGALGVRLRDIPAAAWELLPWSFVLDWIANVGDIVSGLTALCTNDLLTQWVTTVRKQTVVQAVTSFRTTSPWAVSTNCKDSAMCIYETYTRSPMIPGSGMGLAMNFTLNRTPTVSSISLLLQQLTKGK